MANIQMSVVFSETRIKKVTMTAPINVMSVINVHLKKMSGSKTLNKDHSIFNKEHVPKIINLLWAIFQISEQDTKYIPKKKINEKKDHQNQIDEVLIDNDIVENNEIDDVKVSLEEEIDDVKVSLEEEIDDVKVSIDEEIDDVKEIDIDLINFNENDKDIDKEILIKNEIHVNNLIENKVDISTPFFLFCYKQRPLLKENLPELNPYEITEILKCEWRKLILLENMKKNS